MSSVTGSSYEWAFKGTTLPNTKRKLKVTASGTYIRVIDANNCTSAFSPNYSYTIAGIKDDLMSGIALYPNPSTGIVNLVLKEQQVAQVIVLNSMGQVLLSKTVAKPNYNEAVQLNLAAIAKSIYQAQVRTEKQVIIKKIVVE